MGYFKDVLFDPLDAVLKEYNVRENEKRDDQHSALWAALMAGTVWYAHGVFSGTFNAAISRSLRSLGAVRRGATFALAVGDLPVVLRGAVATSGYHAQELHKAITALLDAMEPHIADAPTGITFANTVDTITQDLQEQFSESVSSVEGLPPASPVPEDLKLSLRDEMMGDTDLAAKNFTLEELTKLRATVSDNLSSGARPDQLSKVIAAEFGVAQRKARIIADSETSLLVSRFRQRRYQDLGSKSYRWETSHDEKVRPTHGESNNHRILDGRVFEWSSPPVVDSATGRRRHPGEDFGPCRCQPRCILVLK